MKPHWQAGRGSAPSSDRTQRTEARCPCRGPKCICQQGRDHIARNEIRIPQRLVVFAFLDLVSMEYLEHPETVHLVWFPMRGDNGSRSNVEWPMDFT